jgi:hypothetical protein
VLQTRWKKRKKMMVGLKLVVENQVTEEVVKYHCHDRRRGRHHHRHHHQRLSMNQEEKKVVASRSVK